MSRIDHHRPQFPDLVGQFRKSLHLEMVSDRARTNAVFEGLRRNLRQDHTFVELGCGTGIFSIFAAGLCQEVHCLELDPVVADVAEENILASPLRDKIHLHRGDAMQLDPGVMADVIFSEMMSVWCIEEPQVPVYNRACEDLLKPGGRYLPDRVVNLIELGHYDFRFGDIEMRTAIALFTGIPKPALLTGRGIAKSLEFDGTHVSTDLSAAVELQAVAEGSVNCAVLSSYVQFGPGVVFSGSDSLMPQTVIPLEEELSVTAGGWVRVDVSTRARTDLGEVAAHAIRIEGPSKGSKS